MSFRRPACSLFVSLRLCPAGRGVPCRYLLGRYSTIPSGRRCPRCGRRKRTGELFRVPSELLPPGRDSWTGSSTPCREWMPRRASECYRLLSLARSRARQFFEFSASVSRHLRVTAALPRQRGASRCSRGAARRQRELAFPRLCPLSRRRRQTNGRRGPAEEAEEAPKAPKALPLVEALLQPPPAQRDAVKEHRKDTAAAAAGAACCAAAAAAAAGGLVSSCCGGGCDGRRDAQQRAAHKSPAPGLAIIMVAKRT